MAIIQKGAKVYLFTKGPIPFISGGEPTNQNDKLTGVENAQDYYGDLEQKQKDVIFQPSSYLGTVTNKHQVLNGTLYYNVLIKGFVDKRTDHGWNAGTYNKIDWLAWVSSADLTDSEDVALVRYDKRSDAATKETIKTTNAAGITDINNLPKADTKVKTTSAQTLQQNKTSKKLSTPVTIGIAAGILIITFGAIYYFKRKGQRILQNQITVSQLYALSGIHAPTIA